MYNTLHREILYYALSQHAVRFHPEFTVVNAQNRRSRLTNRQFDFAIGQLACGQTVRDIYYRVTLCLLSLAVDANRRQ